MGVPWECLRWKPLPREPSELWTYWRISPRTKVPSPSLGVETVLLPQNSVDGLGTCPTSLLVVEPLLSLWRARSSLVLPHLRTNKFESKNCYMNTHTPCEVNASLHKMYQKAVK